LTAPPHTSSNRNTSWTFRMLVLRADIALSSIEFYRMKAV
jgi:hypothetical protein